MALGRLHQILVSGWTKELEVSANGPMEKAQISHIITQSRHSAIKSAVRLVELLEEQFARQPKTIATMPALQVVATAAGVLLTIWLEVREASSKPPAQILSSLLDITTYSCPPECRPAQYLQTMARNAISA